MKSKAYLDTETCGLVGPPVLIQTMDEHGNSHVHHVWNESVYKTLKLCEQLCDSIVVGFNLVFDWFHITQIYNLFDMISDKSQPPKIEEVIEISKKQPRYWCLKPAGSLDLLMTVRKSQYQSLMDRRDIRIRKVPIDIAYTLARILRERIELSEIYFAYRPLGYGWDVVPLEEEPAFADLKLVFGASSGLKVIAKETLKTSVIDFPLPDRLKFDEKAYNPYDTGWRFYIKETIKFWQQPRNIEYAIQDVVLLKRLEEHFGYPNISDYDSVLACAVGTTRWCGFNIDHAGVDQRLQEKRKEVEHAPCDIASPQKTKRFLRECAQPIELSLIKDTSKPTLDTLVKLESTLGHFARQIKSARKASKEITILERLFEVGRFCPEFKIIGTRTGRMSGGGFESDEESINPQGIQRDKDFRKLFTLADSFETLSGGDFDSYEITLADAVYKDPNLRADLLAGKKFHALFGEHLYDMDHDKILATRGSGLDLYDPAKKSALALLYGAMARKISSVANVSEAKSESATNEFLTKYLNIGLHRSLIYNQFCSLRQPGGIGSPIEWHEPAEYIESLLGYRRYFTLENYIVRRLYELACNPPKEMDVIGKVIRRKKEQTIKGASQSALFAAAFQLQAYNMRAAANHVIQATGAEIVKQLQIKLWEQQPVGIHAWRVRILNMHDELMVAHAPTLRDKIKQTVVEFIESYRSLVPLISMEWKTNFNNWGEK